MSFESVRAHLAEHAPDLEIIDQGRSTATVGFGMTSTSYGEGRVNETWGV